MSREDYLQIALTLTDDIETKQNELIDLNNETEDVQRQIRVRNADIVTEISSEKLDGKPIFSNEGARNAELAKRSDGDPFIKELQKNATKASNLKTQVSNEISKLQSQASLYKAFLNGSIL